MKKVISVILLVITTGCSTMQIKNTDGIKAMMNARAQAQSLRKQISEATLKNQNELMKLYSDTCDLNNGWIDGLKFDLQVKDVFDVPTKAYTEHAAALSAIRFINSSKSSLSEAMTEPSLRNPPTIYSQDIMGLSEESTKVFGDTGSVGAEVGKFANQIINNMLAQNKKNVEEARKRMYEELEKTKWQK